MFGKVIYFDEVKINEYKSVLLGKNCVKINQIEVSDDKGIGVSIPIASGSIKANKSYTAEIQNSLLLACNEFESVLSEKQVDYSDFTISEQYDISTTPRGYIIKFNGILEIPEGFDISETLHKYKRFFLHESEEFSALIEGKSPSIPLLVELDNNLLCSKIDIEKLNIDYVELEDYENIEITILARMISSNKISKKKAIYDPLKDYITLNRQLRREFANDRPEELAEIFADEDYYVVEVIAMYQ